MTIDEVKNIVESRKMVYKGFFLEQLSKEEFKAGMRKVNLQEITDLDSLNGEGCWAWFSEHDRKKYDNCENGIVKAILANSPVEYMGILFWGSELEVKCNGNYRATLSKEWVNEKILKSDWFNKCKI